MSCRPWGVPRLSCDPPPLYAWDVEVSAAGGRCGVTRDQAAAIKHVQEALTGAPCGSRGRVRRVRPSFSECVTYVEFGTVAQATLTAKGVTWSE
jgi:hypothetical protein